MRALSQSLANPRALRTLVSHPIQYESSLKCTLITPSKHHIQSRLGNPMFVRVQSTQRGSDNNCRRSLMGQKLLEDCACPRSYVHGWQTCSRTCLCRLIAVLPCRHGQWVSLISVTLEHLRADTLRMKRAVAYRSAVDGTSIHGCLGV